MPQMVERRAKSACRVGFVKASRPSTAAAPICTLAAMAKAKRKRQAAATADMTAAEAAVATHARATASTRSTRCPACRTTTCSTRCSRRRRPDARPSTPATSRARPIWRSARRSRPASRQAYAVVPGPGLLNSVGRPAHRLFDERAGAGADRRKSPTPTSAAISAICTRSATRPASSRGWSIIRRCIRKPERGAAPGRRGDALDGDRAGPGPAALECAIDVWGKRGPGDAAAAAAGAARPSSTKTRSARPRKLLGAAKNPMIVCGGGAQDAAAEVTALSRHAAGAGARLSPRPRRARQPRSAERHPAARPRAVGRGRRGAGHRHAHADPAPAMGRRQRPQDRPRRCRPGGARRACTSPRSR